MFRLERIRVWRRVIVSLQLALLLPACTRWQAEPVRPAELVSRRPSVVRVTLPDRTHLLLNDPVVRRDTLYGHRQKLNQALGQRPKAVPLAQVQEIAVLRQDPTRTTLLGFGIAVAAATALCFLADAFGCGEEGTVLPDLVGAE